MSDDPIRVHRIESDDGKSLVDIELMPNGHYRFVEMTEDEGDEYTGPYMALRHFSGLYDSAEAAEYDARQILPWLRDQIAN